MKKFTGDIGSYSGSGEARGPFNSERGLHRWDRTSKYRLVHSCGNCGSYDCMSEESLVEALAELRKANKEKKA